MKGASLPGFGASSGGLRGRRRWKPRRTTDGFEFEVFEDEAALGILVEELRWFINGGFEREEEEEGACRSRGKAWGGGGGGGGYVGEGDGRGSLLLCENGKSCWGVREELGELASLSPLIAKLVLLLLSDTAGVLVPEDQAGA
jgi:hypothetical protein